MSATEFSFRRRIGAPEVLKLPALDIGTLWADERGHPAVSCSRLGKSHWDEKNESLGGLKKLCHNVMGADKKIKKIPGGRAWT
jgi:hypothetical protein